MFTSRPVPSPLAPVAPLGPVPLTGTIDGVQPSGPDLPLIGSDSSGNLVLAAGARPVTVSRLVMNTGPGGGLDLPRYTTGALAGITSPTEGRVVWDSTLHVAKAWNGSAYVAMGGTTLPTTVGNVLSGTANRFFGTNDSGEGAEFTAAALATALGVPTFPGAASSLLSGTANRFVFINGAGAGSELTDTQVNTRLDEARVEYPLALAGWTPTEIDGATIDLDSNGAVVTLPDGVGSCAAFSVRSWSAGHTYEIRARFTVVGTTTASAIGYFVILYGNIWMMIRARGDGRIEPKLNQGNVTYATVDGRPVDGTGEIKIVIRGSRFTTWYGTVGADPEWILMSDDDVAALKTPFTGNVLAPTGIRLQGGTEGGALATETTITWSHIQIRTAFV